MNKEYWLEQLKNGSAQCYIKPNRYKHSSGYRCFEVGYLIAKNGKMKNKLVLGEYSDHILTCGYGFAEQPKFLVNMDLLLDGYIRMWSNESKIWWGNMSFGLSSMQLTLIK